jgi:hypothetical protein
MDMPSAPSSNHGFSLLGDHSLVLSHIPMFMAPHQFQVFLEVTIEGPAGTDPVKSYLDDKKTTGTTDYVLICDPLVLATLAPDAPHRRTQFTGKLFRGWPFNNPNTAPVIVPALTVHVKRAIYFHSILNQPVLKKLTYLGFRTAESDYVVHELVQPPDLKHLPDPPDFCQILAAKISEAGPELAHDAIKIEVPDAANNVANKLKPDSEAKGVSGAYHHIHVHTGRELIFDPNHLLPG